MKKFNLFLTGAIMLLCGRDMRAQTPAPSVAEAPATVAPALTPKSVLKKYMPPIGGVTIWIPETRKEKIERMNIPGGPGYYYLCEAATPEVIYQLAVMLLPESEANPVNIITRFADVLKQMKTNPKMKWLSGGTIAVDGNPGIEFKAESLEQQTTVWSRQFFAFGKVYETTVHARKKEADATIVKTFMDSIEVKPSPFTAANFPQSLMAKKTTPDSEISYLPGIEKVTGKILVDKALKKVMPSVPKTATGAQTTVQILVVVSEEGSVVSVQAVSGLSVLHQPCIDAVQQWIFQPIEVNGKPTKVQGVLTFNFSPN